MALVKQTGFAALLLVAVSSMALAQSSGGAGGAGGAAGTGAGSAGSGASTGPATGGGAPGVAAPGTPGGGASGLGSVGTAPGAAGSSGTAGSATPNGAQLTESTVRQTLQAQGFSQVQNVQRTQNGFVAMAMKNGQSHRVGVDQTGRVVTMD